MTYKRTDWETSLKRLSDARKIYESYKDPERSTRDPGELDDAIWKLWTFSEYVVNVALECQNLSPDTKHTQHLRAKELFSAGSLAQDYSESLEKLNRYRKKAAHLGYARERSTHYSAADVLRALTDMEALLDEVSEQLKKSGRLP